MRWPFIFLATVLLNSFLMVVFSRGSDIPSSCRSRRAIADVKPRLEKELEDQDLKWGNNIFIRIFKEEKQLEVWIRKVGGGFELFKTYDVCTYGQGTLGPKLKEGDGQAPEGFYFVVPQNLNPSSQFHLSFNIGYPNAYDRYHNRTGSAIMVHGRCVSIGCFAMTDPVIEEIYALLDAAFQSGQRFARIHIFPFRMSDENVARYLEHPWYSFWENLKTGYEIFESNNFIPPNVRALDGVYVFE
jgi:murein L,D-transpeptidase YafK